MSTLLQRITLNPKVCNGRPTIRNMRFTVAQMLELLASGMTHEEILEDYPYVERDDILACLLFASKMANAQSIIPYDIDLFALRQGLSLGKATVDISSCRESSTAYLAIARGETTSFP
jgi:uncharacterized protein (DUF433 family)